MSGDEATDKKDWIDIDAANENKFSSTKNTYKDAQKRLFENWKKISPKLFDLMIENEAIDKNPKCSKCSLPAVCYCLDCGTNIYFCLECNNLYHKDINIFHRKLSMNYNTYVEIVKLPQLCKKNCEHEIKEILIINLKGII
jgi:hypothetical protein